MNEKNNPFNISFGEEPKELICRNNEFNEIIETFNSITPISKVLIISGPHGAGKTVLLAQRTKVKIIFYSRKLIASFFKLRLL